MTGYTIRVLYDTYRDCVTTATDAGEEDRHRYEEAPARCVHAAVALWRAQRPLRERRDNKITMLQTCTIAVATLVLSALPVLADGYRYV